MAFKKLEDLREYLRAIPYINSGGCGVAALAMAKWIKKNHKIEVPIVFFYYDAYTYKENLWKLDNRSTMTIWDKHRYALLGANHICISWEGMNIDNEKSVKVGSKYKYLHAITDYKAVAECVANRYIWNDSFDRDKYIPQIEGMLGFKLFGRLKK